VNNIVIDKWNILYYYIEYKFNELRFNEMGIREQQKEKRRQEILEAGLDLFIRKGYSATKIKDIAEQVGMSVGLLFHYFETKEKLYEELVKQGISGPMSMLTNLELEPLEFFIMSAEQIFSYIQSESFVAKMFVLMSQVNDNEAVPQAIQDMMKDFDVFTPTAVMIKKGQDNGTIREGDPYALGVAFWCAIQGVAELVARNPSMPCPKSDWIVDIIRGKV
jgi:AcrR family transcriptional regulator